MDRLRVCLGAILLAVFTNEAAALEQYGQMFFGAPGWQGGSAFSAAFYVEQKQWPAGYGIRLYLPDRRTADIHVIVEGNSLLIHSEGHEQLAPEGAFGPVFVQFGGFSQRLTLPLDADIGRMKLASRSGAIEIFIPRRRQ
jgi:HSP20 family molecular chaperone IbpA